MNSMCRYGHLFSDRSKDVSVTTTRKPQPGTNILGRYHLHKICKCRMGVVIHCTYGEFGVAVMKKNSKMYSFVNYSHIFSYVAKENENIAG